MKPLILHYYYGAMDGVFISTMDLYYNLSKYIDVDYKIVTKMPEQCIRHLFKNNNRDLVPFITDDEHVEADTIIGSTRFVYDNKYKVKCKKLILIDSLDFGRSLHKVQDSIYPKIPKKFKKKDVIFLCNPANMRSRFKYTMVEYFQKMSQERLDRFPMHRARFFGHYYKKKSFLDEVFNYTRITKQWMSMNDGTYFENVGRLIFEHLWAGKVVNYSSEGMFEKKDGLYYYLQLFGVDGAVDHKPLEITKEQIEDILFMKEDDPLIELVS